MRWSYKTIHFELKKDGILGSAFLDDSEMEEILNEYGMAGWELVSLLETRDGVIGVFKQPLQEMVTGTTTSVMEEPERQEHAIPEQSEKVHIRDMVVDDALIEDAAEPFAEPFTEEDEMREDAPPLEDAGTESDEDEEPGVGSIRIE